MYKYSHFYIIFSKKIFIFSCNYFFKSLILLLISIFSSTISYSQNPIELQDSAKNVFSSSVQELLNEDVATQDEDLVAVTGFLLATVRETQGAVTLITDEDIQLSGARDLIDVLRLVPSLDIGRDVDNVIGIAVRGHWANDARVLVLLDGIMLNETSYGTFAIGQRVALDNISRIEITRSAGSVKYGGNAALAVINIITKKKLNNLIFSSNVGFAKDGISRSNLQLQTGKRFANDITFSVSAFANQGDRSHQTLDLPTGETINYADSSRVNTANFNFAFDIKNFHARFLYENYAFEASDSPLDVLMRSYNANLYYDWKPNDKLKITPRIRISNQLPWNYSSDIPTIYEYFNSTNTRLNTDVIATYQANQYFTFSTGLVYQYDYSRNLTALLLFNNNKNTISYTTLAAFGEMVLHTKYATISGGLRIDDHSALTPAAAPRFAVTKAFKNTHFKFIYSRSFKIPTIQNFNLSGEEGLKPEFVQFLEVEAGAYLVNTKKRKLLLTTNLYRIKLTDPIIYGYNPIASFETYTNFPKTGTQGLETELRYTSPKIKIIANYSLYNPYQNDIEELKIEENNKQFLAFPNTKMNFFIAYKITPSLSASTTATWQNERFTYLQTDPNSEDLELIRYKPVFFGNVFFQYKNIAKTGIDIGFGVYNLFDTPNVFLYPTNTSIVPLADQSREFLIRLRYTITE
jgi:outer membrane cobalamin receptor